MAGDRDKNLPLAETLASPVPRDSPAPPETSPAPRATDVPTDPSAPTLAATHVPGTTPAPPGEEIPLAEGTPIGERYVVGVALGRGGMGTVYLARDVTLGRDVALKLHRHGSNHDRLYREALAMAQLAHPNVVTVFEVGTFEDQLFVAMEYVRGSTLRDWLAKKPRSWREIMEVLRAVGDGLVAAHRAELVHRDFKPENVLVGEDGRARVSDFGLARANAAVDSLVPASASTRPSGRLSGSSSTPLPMNSSMTVTGALLGTPAYMPPEQYAGEDVDARGDQFSFCVAAWESLYGARPYSGATLPALQQAIERGQIERPTATEVPVEVRRVLERGLSAIPDNRWPSMSELLAALDAATRPRSRRTLWIALAATGVLAAGGAAIMVTRKTAPGCEAAATELDALVTPARRTELIELARRHGDAETVARVTKNLDQFATGYRNVAISACKARSSRDWSPDLAVRAASCRRDAAQLVAAELAGYSSYVTSGRTLATMTTELGEIGELTACSDPTVLASLPSRTEEVGREIATLRAARRFVEAGKPELAQRQVDRVKASPNATVPGVVAALAVLRAQIAAHEGDYTAAVKEAKDAYYAAHSNGDRGIELVALRQLLYWIGNEQQDMTAVEPWYRLAFAEIDRFSTISRAGAARLRSALVGVAMGRNEIPVALEQAKLAIDAFGTDYPVAHAQAVRDYASALATSGDVVKAIEQYEQSIAEMKSALGPDDLDLGPILGDEALTLAEAGQNEKALDVAKGALELVKRQRVRDLTLADVELNVAATLINGDLGEQAETLLLDARPIYVASLGAANPVIATIDSNLSLIASDRKNYPEAVRLLTNAIAIQEKALGPSHPEVAISLYNLAAAQRRAGDLQGALASARRCTEIRKASLATSDMYIYTLAMQSELEADLGDPATALVDADLAIAVNAPRANFQAVAWPALAKGRALLALHRDEALARKLLGQARALYSENKMAERIAQIDALLGTRR